jgi:hypothetical protein
LLALALVMSTAVAYSPVLDAGWVWDDDAFVTENPVLKDMPPAAGLRAIWIPGSTPQYYPLTYSSFWIEERLYPDLPEGGKPPRGYHVVNVALHAADALLVLAVALAIGLSPAVAWSTAFLFALHPVHVESVAWVTERKNVLSGFFYLLALLAYLGFDRRRTARPDDRAVWGRWLLAFALFAAAVLSKTVTASLPAVVVLVLFYWREPLSWWRLWPLLPLLAFGAAAGMLTAHYERVLVGAVGPEWHLGFAERFLIAARAGLFYPRMLLVPWPLLFVYPRWTIDPADPLAWWPVAVWLVIALGLAVLLWRGRRGVPVAIAVYAVSIFPALGFANVFPMRYSFVADHFQYLASLGILVLVAAAAHRLPWAALRYGVLTLLLAAGLVLTQRQSRVWHDARTLYGDTVRRNPAAWMAHANLASIELVEARQLAAAGKPREATEAVRRAEAHARAGLAHGPSDPPLLVNLASALQALGRNDEAAAVMATATAAVREQIAHHRSAGNRERQTYSEAMLVTYETMRGGLAEQAGEAAAAADAYQAALALDGDALGALAGLARLAAARGDLEAAATHAAVIVAANPADAGAHRLLARHAAAQGKWRDAVGHLERARANLGSASAPAERAGILVDLVWLRVSAPDPAVRAGGAALAAARELVALRGEDDAGALDALAAALASEQRFDEAIEVATKARELAQGEQRAAIDERLAGYRAAAAR